MEGVEGVVREVIVIRSVTICGEGCQFWALGRGYGEGEGARGREGRETHAFVERLPLPYEHDVALDKVRV